MLKEHIEQILKNYKRVRNETFTEHPIATLLRTTFPEDLEKIINKPNKYKITGSAGQGNWTYSPWVAIFDKRITKNAQSGFYPVYLFKEDMSGVYLSLNQGATDLKNKYGTKRANEILNKRSKEFREKLNGLIPVADDLLESIDLKVENSPNAPFYETCNIYAKYYSLEDLPSEEKLELDLKEILEMYDLLISEDFNPDHRGRAHIVRDICYLISKNEFPTEKALYGILGENVVDETYWKAYFQNCQKENCPKYNLESARSLNLVQNDELKLTKLGEELITQTDPNELFTYNYSLGVKRFFYKVALEDEVVRRTMEILKEKRELRFFAPTCNRTNKVVWKYNKKTYKCEETKYPECSGCDRVLTGHIKETSLPFEAFRETGKRSGFVFWMCSRITPMHLTGHDPVYSGNYIYWDDKAEEELKMGLSDEKIKELLSWFVNSSETYKKWSPKRKTAEKINHEWIQPEIIEKMSYEDLKEHYLEYFNSGTGEKQNLIAIKRDQIIRNEKFRESLLYLLNEDVDIKTRIDELMDIKNDKHIDGMSRALITAFLMDFKPDKYCLWNGKTESGFKALDWENLYKKRGDSTGDVYIKVLGLLERLKTLGSDLGLNFLDVDLFLHVIAAEKEGIDKLNEIRGLKSSDDDMSIKIKAFHSFFEYLSEKGYFFEQELVENFLLSLKVKPFVILTGNSGTGKTKLAQLFAQYSEIISPNNSTSEDIYSAKEGVSSFLPSIKKSIDSYPYDTIRSVLPQLVDKTGENVENKKYEIVPVGANWTENRHIVGFYNVITEEYEKTPALARIIMHAIQISELPYSR